MKPITAPVQGQGNAVSPLGEEGSGLKHDSRPFSGRTGRFSSRRGGEWIETALKRPRWRSRPVSPLGEEGSGLKQFPLMY